MDVLIIELLVRFRSRNSFGAQHLVMATFSIITQEGAEDDRPPAT